MKVVIRQKAGYTTREGLVFEVGDVAEFDDGLAIKLINYGIAAPAPAPKVETTAKAAPKVNAAKRVSKPAPSKAAPKEEAAAKDRKKD
jgi:hypothetical protein